MTTNNSSRMFGGEIDCPPVPPPRERLSPELQDNLLTTPDPYHYGHHAPHPATDYRRRLMQYKQRDVALYKENLVSQLEEAAKIAVAEKFMSKAHEVGLNNEIKVRVNAKMKEYEEQIHVRRSKLKDLLGREEREFCKETVDYLQKGKDLKFKVMMERRTYLCTTKEEERRKVVEEKRLQQAMANCQEVGPYLSKKKLMESKEIQLQQMRENESRRQAEKEIDMMWTDVMNRNDQAIANREKQDMLNRYDLQQKQNEDLRIQIRGKELAREEAARLKREAFDETEKLVMQWKNEDIKDLKDKQKKKEQYVLELEKQIQLQKKIIKDRQQSEEAIDLAFAYLTKLEQKREKARKEDNTAVAKQEGAAYRRYLANLLKHRQDEELEADKSLEANHEMILRQQDEVKCKLQEAREKLQKDVLKAREEQLLYKKQEAELQKKRKQADDELCSMTWQAHADFAKNYFRRCKEAAKEHGDCLTKQMEYKRILKERKQKEIERQVEIAKQQDEEYRNRLFLSIEREAVRPKHPFRKVVERYDCHCTKTKP